MERLKFPEELFHCPVVAKNPVLCAFSFQDIPRPAHGQAKSPT